MGVLGGGKQGFQKAPTLDSFIIDGVGAMGTVQTERNLSYYEVSLSGHMVPQFAPQVRFPQVPSSALEIDYDLLYSGCIPEHAVAFWDPGEPLKCNS